TGSVSVCSATVERMNTAQLTAIFMLAVAGSYTPGPNNTIAMVTGVHHGFARALPHIAGVVVGFSSMLALGVAGVAALITAQPALLRVITFAALAYLLYLAWQLWKADAMHAQDAFKPFSFFKSVFFQYINPKAWMFAVALTTATAGVAAGWLEKFAVTAGIVALHTVLALALWAWAGDALSQWLRVGTRLMWFNRAMAVLLAGTALWMGLRA
ncbi:MAG: LysE family translocator, partial [Burkholderiaceae bacterium]